MEKEVWIKEIQSVAVSEGFLNKDVVSSMDCNDYWNHYGVSGVSPLESLEEDFSYL